MRGLGKSLQRFAASADGAILAEALIVIPIVTVLAIGLLEFGSLFWQRQQMEVGVRDAARYWARCRPDFGPCTATIARNIAFFGNPAGTGYLRVPNWYRDTDLEVTPATPPDVPSATDVVTVSGTLSYQGSPMSSLLGLNLLVVGYTHQQRYIGW
jgi:hypothetical protein